MTQVPLVPQVRQARQEQQVHKEFKARQVRLDLQVLQEAQEQREQLDRLELKEMWATLDLLVPQELQDPLVLPALKAFRASPGLLAPLVLPVALAQPDPRVPLEPVSPDLQVPRAPRVLRVLLAVALPVGQRRPQHTRLSLVIGFWPTLLVVRSRLHFRPRPLLATT